MTSQCIAIKIEITYVVPVVVVTGKEQFLPLSEVYPLIHTQLNDSGFESFPVHSVKVPHSELQSFTKIKIMF